MTLSAPRAAIVLVALAACGPATPLPLPPPTVSVPVATSEPPATPAATAPAAPEPPLFEPRPPFAVVARAGGEEDFAVFPLEGGAAIIVTAQEGDVPHTLRLAVLDRDEIAPAPELATGLPPAVLIDKDLPLVAGRWPDALWLTRGDRACEAYRWEPQRRTWEARPAKAPPGGKCTHLAAWTPGAAIAAVEGPKGPGFAAFGAAPRALPAAPPRRPDQPKDCAELAGNVHQLFAFSTGEVIAVGAKCNVQGTWLARWANGAAKGDAIDAEIDPNGPYLARALSKDEVVIDGAGVIQASNGEVSVEARFRVVTGRLRRVSIEEHEVNALERWMVQGREIFGVTEADPSDGFRYEGYHLTPGDEVFVTGRLMRGGKPVGSLLLRNRAVKKALALP
jgi:predicted small lipoprotein YifL